MRENSTPHPPRSSYAESVPEPRPSYSLGELLAQCDETAPDSDADREWIEGKPLGAELL